MKFATISEAASVLGRSEQQLRRGVESGRYPHAKICGRKLVDIDELTEIIKAENATIGIKEAAELTGLPAKTIRRGAREGWLPCSKGAKAYEFIPGQLLEALEGMKERKDG